MYLWPLAVAMSQCLGLGVGVSQPSLPTSNFKVDVNGVCIYSKRLNSYFQRESESEISTSIDKRISCINELVFKILTGELSSAQIAHELSCRPAFAKWNHIA